MNFEPITLARLRAMHERGDICAAALADFECVMGATPITHWDYAAQARQHDIATIQDAEEVIRTADEAQALEATLVGDIRRLLSERDEARRIAGTLAGRVSDHRDCEEVPWAWSAEADADLRVALAWAAERMSP